MGDIDLRRLVRAGHYGLAGMRERVEMIGGRLDIDQPDVGGTRLRVVAGVPAESSTTVPATPAPSRAPAPTLVAGSAP